MDLIDQIKLSDSFDAYVDPSGRKVDWLNDISTINLFIGANNTGKSRFMRLLAGEKEYCIYHESYNLEEKNKKISTILDYLIGEYTRTQTTEINGLKKSDLEGLRPLPRYFMYLSDVYNRVREVFTKLSTFTQINSWTSNTHNTILENLLADFKNKAGEALEILKEIPNFIGISSPPRVYIPVLRGLRTLDEKRTDYYLERTKKDYFASEISQSPEIYTGLTFFDRLTSLLLGDNSSRNLIQQYQKFLSLEFFENQTITLIPSIDTGTVVIKIGSEKEQPIHNLGDGIQSAIIISFLPFVTPTPSFFFIEEPELYLHPGLQRKILTFFAKQNKHIFFFTTQSNHFLDLSIDFQETSIITFQKKLEEKNNEDEISPSFIIETIDNRKTSSLKLLGVRNSSVFLANATIWVEGITDRWYLRAMLKSYLDHLKINRVPFQPIEEDFHYCFVEYGGSNITHWSFLDYEEHPIEVERLCSRAMVIVDRDGNHKLKRQQDLENILQERLIVLPSREIENLLPYTIIKQVVAEYENKELTSFPDIKFASYKEKYLGKFIETNILKNQISRKGGYKTESGTLKTKVDFCEKACPLIVFNELDIEVQNVIKKIYDFIVYCNS